MKGGFKMKILALQVLKFRFLYVGFYCSVDTCLFSYIFRVRSFGTIPE